MVKSLIRHKPSLRRKILKHVLLPLTLTWAIGTSLALGLAHYFTTQAYDRALLDDAFALSAQVRSDSRMDGLGRTILNLSLTDAEMGAVLFDQSESIYFSVWRADGTLLAGHKGLRPPLAVGSQAAAPAWRDGVYLGTDVRIVSLSRDLPAPHTVLVAQTTASRTNMLERLLFFSLLPQFLLLVVLAWWLRRQVGADLAPLSFLQHAVDARDSTDLSPVPEALTVEASTSSIGHLGLAINALFHRLQLALQAQREFSSNVAHELRTPIASIRLQAEHALTLRGAEDAALRLRLHKLLASTDHASRLIDQLLALAFADEAKDSVALERLDITELVRDVVLRHLPRAQANEQRGAVDFGAEGLDELIDIMGDRTLLEAVLDNLIDNAFRYGLSGAASKVTVSVRRQEGAVELCVEDAGIGLSQPEIEAYQLRWKQASHAFKAGAGVGLGLSIVSRYAQLLKAEFTLASPSGVGLCAKLKFKDELSPTI